MVAARGAAKGCDVTGARRRILGIDPGSQATGYGVVDDLGDRIVAVAWGVVRTAGGVPFADRLDAIQRALAELIRIHRPTEAAVEKVFVAKNAAAALKLGQARGAVIATCSASGVAIYEYSAREIKAAATGYGAAPKEQVAGMVRRLLGIRGRIAHDASDALAAAYCRAVTRRPGM